MWRSTNDAVVYHIDPDVKNSDDAPYTTHQQFDVLKVPNCGFRRRRDEAREEHCIGQHTSNNCRHFLRRERESMITWSLQCDPAFPPISARENTEHGPLDRNHPQSPGRGRVSRENCDVPSPAE